MTDATLPTVQTQHSSPYRPSEAQGLAAELAKCLKLVAPAGMNAEQQTVWLHTAVDALEDIRPAEVQAVSAEIRRSVTRPAQIVPEIARLVSERRKYQIDRAGPWTAMDYARRARENCDTRLESLWLDEARRLGETSDFSGDKD